MSIVYKFRSTLLYDGDDKDIPRDVKSLLEYKLYAPDISTFNDVFEMGYDDRPIYEALNTFDALKLVNTEQIRDNYDNLKKHIKSVGVYSLFVSETDIPDNVLMWAYYGDSHKGFCIAYDLEQLEKSEEYAFDVNLAKVEYTESYPILSLDKLGNKDEMIKTIISSKSIDWKHENEIRLIYEHSGEHRFNKHAIKAIYFGLQMDKKNIDTIINGLDGIDVKFYQMERVPHSYKLTAKLVDEKHRIDKKDLLDENLYQIMRYELRNTIENFDVLYKGEKNKTSIEAFVKSFRKQHATKDSNISLFDDLDIKPLLTKYPLSGKENLFFNKHWVAAVNFGEDSAFMWPGGNQ